jgi:hypothetical protein
MQSDDQRLNEADACHDEQPERAAALLLGLDPAQLDSERRPLLAFLANHVLGEKLSRWADANALLARLLAHAGAQAPAVLWRQAAVAAAMCGDDAAATQATDALAERAQVGTVQAAELVQLARVAFIVAGLDAPSAAQQVLAAMEPLDTAHWQQASALDTPAAASCNNIAADLSERPVAELPALHAALLRAARCSQRLWLRAGDWVHHERACYGLAVAHGALGEHAAALQAARDGLALLDGHDAANEQTVDRAFLELEQSFALHGLRDAAAAANARARADALAARFDDDALQDWYGQRVQRHHALRAASGSG